MFDRTRPRREVVGLGLGAKKKESRRQAIVRAVGGMGGVPQGRQRTGTALGEGGRKNPCQKSKERQKARLRQEVNLELDLSHNRRRDRVKDP